MRLGSWLRPLKRQCYRHIPAGSSLSALDFRYCGMRSDGRWHYRGQPTLYLACSEDVALMEFCRHFDEHRQGLWPFERVLWRLDVQLEKVLDMRDPRLQAHLDIQPPELLDELKTHAFANLVRATSPAQGLLVFPMGAFDRPDLWNRVVFLERVSEAGTPFVAACKQVGTFTYQPGS